MNIKELKEAAEAIKSSDYHDLDAYLSAANPSTILSLIARVEQMEEALRAVQQQCLFDDDDGVGVSEDVVIPSDLFDRICDALNSSSALETPANPIEEVVDERA